jgi:DNA polymerase-3 subunit delta
MMTFEEVMGNLKKKIYHPVYFLQGDEPYYIDKISDYISENLLTAEEKGFNQTILYGKDLDIRLVIANAKRYPMMSNYQVVIVREAQHIKEIELLEKYLESPLNSTILVFCYKYKTLDKRTKLYKLVDQKGAVYESKKIYDDQLPTWITNYLRLQQASIEPQAAAMIGEFLGSDLSKVVNELDKLIISVPKGVKITPDHVAENIGISKNFNVFELQNALGDRNILKANQIVNYFGENPTANPIGLTIANLFGYFSKVLKYHFLEDKSERNAAAVIGINQFFVKNYARAARNYDIRKLVEIISHLREYDLKSKGWGNVSASQADLQKEMIYRIFH